MHIALVSEHANPLAVIGGADAGGQNVYVADLAAALADLGAEVTVHTRRDDPMVSEFRPLCPGVTVHHVHAGPARPLAKDDLLPYMGQFADGIAAHWHHHPPDAVHAHFWMSGLAAVSAARRSGVPVLLTFHASGAEKRQEQAGRDTSPPVRIDAERWLAATVDLVVATTEHERRRLCAGGAPRERITVLPCGVDHRVFTPTGSRWPAPSDRRRVVVVSRLVERKGIGNVLAALAEVPDTELLVAGGPPQGLLQGDPEASRLQELAVRLGMEDRVQLLGSVDRATVPALLRSADVVACCPWYEPFGLVAVEAMACGRPVVATAVGGLAETVLDGRTGLLVPPRRPDAIAEAVRTLLDDRARADEMGRAGAARARRYDWPTIAAALIAEVRRLRTVPAPAAAAAEEAS